MTRGADVLVHEVMYEPALDAICARLDNATRLRQHLLDSHTTLDQVGAVASAAGVKCLVLSHFVPAEGIADDVWRDGAARNFAGRIVLGQDLMEL